MFYRLDFLSLKPRRHNLNDNKLYLIINLLSHVPLNLGESVYRFLVGGGLFFGHYHHVHVGVVDGSYYVLYEAPTLLFWTDQLGHHQFTCKE